MVEILSDPVTLVIAILLVIVLVWATGGPKRG